MAILGLFAASAVAAQAATWHINGTPFTGSETLESCGGLSCPPEIEPPVEEPYDGEPFTLEVPALAAEIVCYTEEDHGRIFNSTEDEATITFDDCEVVGSEVCVVNDIVVENAHTHLVSVDGVNYDIFTPQGEDFTIIEISGKECPLAGPGGAVEEYEVTGEAAGEGQESESEVQELRFSEESAENAGTELFFLGLPAHFTGTSYQWLTGANRGAPWGAS